MFDVSIHTQIGKFAVPMKCMHSNAKSHVRNNSLWNLKQILEIIVLHYTRTYSLLHSECFLEPNLFNFESRLKGFKYTTKQPFVWCFVFTEKVLQIRLKEIKSVKCIIVFIYLIFFVLQKTIKRLSITMNRRISMRTWAMITIGYIHEHQHRLHSPHYSIKRLNTSIERMIQPKFREFFFLKFTLVMVSSFLFKWSILFFFFNPIDHLLWQLLNFVNF